MSRDSAWLRDIVIAGQKAIFFAAGKSLEDFRADEQMRSAVLYQLTVIGEAARRVSDECRIGHPEIPWARIISLRNVVVHEYATVGLDRVWNVLESALPDLVTRLDGLTREDTE
jgi:uncharacterized protein with HEPN domain